MQDFLPKVERFSDGILDEDDEDTQFEVMDTRSVAEIAAVLSRKGFDPVFTDWRGISNASV